MLMCAGMSQASDNSQSQHGESNATQPGEPAISSGANDADQYWFMAYLGTNLGPEEAKLKKLHREKTSAILTNNDSRKMDEIDPCSEMATSDQRKMLRDREIAQNALGTNSDKVPKYNPGADLPGARQNSVNGMIVQRSAAAAIEDLISNDLSPVMDMLLTQHHVERVIAGDGQEQREIAVTPLQTKAILAYIAGLSNLIGDDSIERLQKAQKIAKAVGVTQQQQKFQQILVYYKLTQTPRATPMTMRAGIFNTTPMGTVPLFSYQPRLNFNQGYGYGYRNNFQ
ncbi:MAG: hypothetical protein EZS28_036058 [Streblomastix strix]|uniref:Uncharacterized protein n=1 Tax=Streblomastix strix TaxID=222440 RepID=A0A5J4UC82_9EUKA|nr:MAG: hypothetical protein EZS28_036058 [Streblomastix strix]